MESGTVAKVRDYTERAGGAFNIYLALLLASLAYDVAFFRPVFGRIDLARTLLEVAVWAVLFWLGVKLAHGGLGRHESVHAAAVYGFYLGLKMSAENAALAYLGITSGGALQTLGLMAFAAATYLIVGWALGIIIVTCGSLVSELIPKRIRMEWT